MVTVLTAIKRMLCSRFLYIDRNFVKVNILLGIFEIIWGDNDGIRLKGESSNYYWVK